MVSCDNVYTKKFRFYNRESSSGTRTDPGMKVRIQTREKERERERE